MDSVVVRAVRVPKGSKCSAGKCDAHVVYKVKFPRLFCLQHAKEYAKILEVISGTPCHVEFT